MIFCRTVLCLLLLRGVTSLPLTACTLPRYTNTGDDKFRVLYMETVALKQRGQTAAALETALQALQLSPRHAGICYQLAQLYAADNNYRECLYYFKMASKRATVKDYSPQDLPWMIKLAQILYDCRAWPEALLQWQRVLQAVPDHAFAQYMLGKTYMDLGEWEKGRLLCDKATGVLP